MGNLVLPGYTINLFTPVGATCGRPSNSFSHTAFLHLDIQFGIQNDVNSNYCTDDRRSPLPYTKVFLHLTPITANPNFQLSYDSCLRINGRDGDGHFFEYVQNDSYGIKRSEGGNAAVNCDSADHVTVEYAVV